MFTAEPPRIRGIRSCRRIANGCGLVFSRHRRLTSDEPDQRSRNAAEPRVQGDRQASRKTAERPGKRPIRWVRAESGKPDTASHSYEGVSRSPLLRTEAHGLGEPPWQQFVRQSIDAD